MRTEAQDSAPFSTRFKITATLSGLGAACGAVAGVPLTYLGNVISGYPIPPTLGVYAWNSFAFASIGAVVGPSLAWTLLRNVPLWRAITEPAIAAAVAAVGAMIVAPSFFVAAVPVAAIGAALRLQYVYRDASPAVSSAVGTDALPSSFDDAKDHAGSA